MKRLLIILMVVMSIVGCTDNKMARQYGGTETIELPTGQRVMGVTWKETDVWVLTRVDTSIRPTRVVFQEKSSMGVFEGEIIINQNNIIYNYMVSIVQMDILLLIQISSFHTNGR